MLDAKPILRRDVQVFLAGGLGVFYLGVFALELLPITIISSY